MERTNECRVQISMNIVLDVVQSKRLRNIDNIQKIKWTKHKVPSSRMCTVHIELNYSLKSSKDVTRIGNEVTFICAIIFLLHQKPN